MKRKILCLVCLLLAVCTCCTCMAESTVVNSIGLFDFSELSFIQGVEHFESEGLQTFRIALQEDVYYGGSDGFNQDYLTARGVVTALDLDFDGDGAAEHLVFTSENIPMDGYQHHTFTLSVYENEGGEYVLADAVELCGFGFEVDSYVRMVHKDGRLMILDGWTGIFDGGVTEFFGRIISYDGSRLMMERALYASTYGNSLFYTVPVDPEIAGDVWGLMDEEVCRGLGLAEGRDYIFLPHDEALCVTHPVYDLYYQMDGLETANEILADYGMNVFWDMQDGYIEAVGLSGGEIILDYATPVWLDNGGSMLELVIRSDFAYNLPGGNMNLSQFVEDYSYEEFLRDDPWASVTGYTTGNVNLRTGPGLDYDTIGSIPSGAVVDYLEETSIDDRGVAWHYVSYNGMQGWGSSKYVSLD